MRCLTEAQHQTLPPTGRSLAMTIYSRIFPQIKILLWTLAFFIIALVLQWRNGAYQSGFGSYPDEAGHYVTGLMVYKYLTTAAGANPMAFAERFYAHYPAVGFGHWPPLFYIVQAIWGCIFGLSRTSDLVLMAALTAVVASMLFRAVGAKFGEIYGTVFACLLVFLPIVQLHTSMIMAEVLLTMFTFAVLVACIKLVETPTRGRALWLGVCLAAAILVKGNAWALLALLLCAPFMTDAPWRFVGNYLWIPLLCVGVFCAPITFATMKMTRDGWDQPLPSLGFFLKALPSVIGDHTHILGGPLTALALVGIYSTIIRSALSRRAADPFWSCNFILILGVLLFHTVVPTSLETRKIFMSIPSLLFFAAAGLKAVLDALPTLLPLPELTYPLAAGLALGGIFLMNSQTVRHTNMGEVAQTIIDWRSLDRTALLVASTSRDEREELSFVAEIASRENADYRHAVIRAGKFVASSSWLGRDYKLIYSDPSQLMAAIREVPVSAVVLYVGRVIVNAHGPLIGNLMAANSGEWVKVQSQANGRDRIECFRSRVLPEGPVQLPSIDLSRKLGRTVSAEF
jgi:hypothetical protein